MSDQSKSVVCQRVSEGLATIGPRFRIRFADETPLCDDIRTAASERLGGNIAQALDINLILPNGDILDEDLVQADPYNGDLVAFLESQGVSNTRPLGVLLSTLDDDESTTDDDAHNMSDRMVSQFAVCKLGCLVRGQRCRLDSMDNMLVDLSMFSTPYQTEAIKEAVCAVYAFFAESEDLSYLSKLVVQSPNREDITVNTLAGYVQLGKTIGGAAAAFLLSYCSLVPVVFVREKGGDESMDNFARAIASISADVVCHLRSKIRKGDLMLEEHQLPFFAPDVMTAADYVAKDVAEMGYGHRRSGLIILGRQNVSTVEKLFNSSVKKGVTSFTDGMRRHAVMDFGTNMKRYALICDEDDAAQGSAGRDATRTDVVNYQQERNFSRLMLRFRVNGPVVSIQPQNDDNVVDDDDDEEDEDEEEDHADTVDTEVIPFQKLINRQTVRCTAACIIQISATWIANELYSRDKYRQKTRIIPMPVSEKYVGIWPPDCPRSRQVEVHTVEPARKPPRRPTKPKPSKRGAKTEAILARKRLYDENMQVYDSQREAYLKCKPWYAHQLGLETMFENIFSRWATAPHVSVHINTHKTTNNFSQDLLAHKILDRFGDQAPLISFAYNQLSAADMKLYISNHRNWLPENELRLALGRILRDNEKCNGIVRTDGISGYVVSLRFKNRALKIQRVYSIVYALFEHMRIKPFVVCNTGALGGRAFTLKTEDHRYPLTDQYFDASQAKTTHMERLLQYTGRIASKDDEVHLVRHLWLPLVWREKLYEAIRFYAEVLALYSRYPDSEFHTILDMVDGRRDGVVQHAFLEEATELSRPKIVRPLKEQLRTRVKRATRINRDSLTQKGCIGLFLREKEGIPHSVDDVMRTLSLEGRLKNRDTSAGPTPFRASGDPPFVFVFKTPTRGAAEEKQIRNLLHAALTQLFKKSQPGETGERVVQENGCRYVRSNHAGEPVRFTCHRLR